MSVSIDLNKLRVTASLSPANSFPRLLAERESARAVIIESPSSLCPRDTDLTRLDRTLESGTGIEGPTARKLAKFSYVR